MIRRVSDLRYARPVGIGGLIQVRFFKKRISVEEQYTRYHTAREAVSLGVLKPGSAQLDAAKEEMLQTLGPAFDPTVRGWLRLPLIDPGLRDFMTRAIDPALEDARDLDAYAEQILAIVALEIDPVTGDVVLEVGRSLFAELGFYREQELVARGQNPEVASEAAYEQALAVTRRYLASTQVGATEQ